MARVLADNAPKSLLVVEAANSKIRSYKINHSIGHKFVKGYTCRWCMSFKTELLG